MNGTSLFHDAANLMKNQPGLRRVLQHHNGKHAIERRVGKGQFFELRNSVEFRVVPGRVAFRKIDADVGRVPEHGLEAALACTRIEAVIRRLDSGEAGLRETLELCQEGRRLVEFCAGELDAVAQGLEELRLDELVARLEAGSRPGATAQAA